MAKAHEIEAFGEEMKALYPDIEISPRWMLEWLKTFHSCPLPILYKALEEHAKTSRFKPAMSDIYQHAIQINGGKFGRKFESHGPFRMEWIKSQVAKGKRPAFANGTFWGWRDVSDCVYHEGHWKPVMEFLMDVLSPAEVTRQLTEFFEEKNTPPVRAVRHIYEKLKHNSALRHEYKKKLADLVEQAKYFSGQQQQQGMNI